MNKNLLPIPTLSRILDRKAIGIAIIIAGVLIAGAVIYTNYPKQKESGEILSFQEAGEKVINFINDNILVEGRTASLIEVLENNGLYNVKFDVEGEKIEWRITKDGELILPQVIDLTNIQPAAEEQGAIIGGFSVSDDEICKEDGKPIIYFFGSQECGYCKWEHPVIEAVAARFEEYIAFHNNMDSDNDGDVFSKYSPKEYVPALVLGCKYFRVGAGTQSGEEKESQHLTALICKLTDGQPADVCSQAQDLINEIHPVK